MSSPETDFKWADCDVDGLKKYLVDEKQFAEERVLKAIERLQKCKSKSSQNRLESFFGPSTIVSHKKKEVAPAKGKGKGKLVGKGKGIAKKR